MQDEFLRLQKLLRKTIVFITHDFDEAIRLGDRIGIMKDGYLVQLGTPEEIVTRPADDYVSEFTKHAPRDRIITVASIMERLSLRAEGQGVPAGTRIGDVAARVLSSDAAIPVLDGNGETIGVITREAMIRALYPRYVA
jgi:glycine betaine/proline transport system ATP-binding protein